MVIECIHFRVIIFKYELSILFLLGGSKRFLKRGSCFYKIKKIKMVDNTKYDFKTLKVRPTTHKRIIKCKAKIENDNGKLLSFDSVINFLLDRFEKK